VSWPLLRKQGRFSRSERDWLDSLSDDEMGPACDGLGIVDRAVKNYQQQQTKQTTFNPPARRRAQP
jgi:hypothetical protein